MNDLSGYVQDVERRKCNFPQTKRRFITGKKYTMPRKNRVLNVGDTAPLFTLPSHQKQHVSLASHREKEHVVLTFFRGTW